MSELKTPGLVVSAEYFPHQEDQTHPMELAFTLGDEASQVHDAVGGIWVPNWLTGDSDAMSGIVQVANGKPFVPYDYRADHPYYEAPLESAEELKARIDARSALEATYSRPLIIDTCVDGGIGDIVRRMDRLLDRWRAKNTILTVSPSASEEGVKTIKAAYEGEEGLGFYMVATYPENTRAGIRKFNKRTEGAQTQHVAELAAEYELDGVIGFSGLVKRTLQQQRLVAMGVTVDGKGYYSPVPRIGTRSGRDNQLRVYKRAKTPAAALDGASYDPSGRCNTELLAGRAVMPPDVKAKFKDEKVSWDSDAGHEVIHTIQGNILQLRDMARTAMIGYGYKLG